MTLLHVIIFLIGSALQGLVLGAVLYVLVSMFLARVPEPFDPKRLFRDEIDEYKKLYPEIPYDDESKCREIGRESFRLGTPYWRGNYKIQETVWWREGWLEARNIYMHQTGNKVPKISGDDFNNWGDEPPIAMWDIGEQQLFLILSGKKPRYKI